MILEDDVRASYTLESTVNHHGKFQVVAVSETCAEAIEQFKLYTPDLVFVDITLPDGNGLNVIKKLRELSDSCHFIMTTAVRETTVVEKAVQLGVIDYLVKPIRMSRVNQALDDYLKSIETFRNNATVDQAGIDSLLGKNPTTQTRRTPKGIDTATLERLRDRINELRLTEFSAEEVGQIMDFSRITARRYLEYLESEGTLKLELDYNTGGRPRRVYKML
ncbi:response regulator [Vibrio viridaestus]|uniref:Transcriptional regulatory protein n=2 Tax=Vibrio viridaestus TaxID=2487322 RepID=A0A3N9TJH5_9VIBR|nr:response regulator [Vibrio viridaestus]